MAKKRATQQLTVSTQGVFSEGVRQENPDPSEVAQVLAAPQSVSLWVSDPAIVEVLRSVIQNSSISAFSLPNKTTGKPPVTSQAKPQGADLSLFVTTEEKSYSADYTVSNDNDTLEKDELLWGQKEGDGAALVERFKTRFHPVPGGVGFFAEKAPFFLPLSEREAAFITARLTARNAALELLTPEILVELALSEQLAKEILAQKDAEPVATIQTGKATTGTVQQSHDNNPILPATLAPIVSEAIHYFLHTGQEIDVLERSAADGKRGKNWKSEATVGKRIYQAPGASHRVELRENDESETQQGIEELKLATLEHLTLDQDTDFAFAMLYVAAALAPPAPLPANTAALGWIDLDDVMEKIGWYPSELSIADREAKRTRLWNYLCYGNRAVVVGQRSSSYRDPITGEEISTRIESPIWRIMSVERPVEQGLTNQVPRRVELVISKEWEPMLMSARLAQYLPLAEVVGKIPPKKVAGDWARSIALVLARLWRMKPQTFLAGQLRPTRRELLTHYTPKTKTVEELLSSSNPKRAVNYWHDALGILCEVGFLASKGETTRSVSQMLENHSAYRWQQAWLDEVVELQPGQTLSLSIQERAASLPAPLPKPLGKKRGRPRKKSLD